MADFTVRDGDPFGFDVSVDGSLVAEHGVRPRHAACRSKSRPQSLLTYTHLDGTTRETARRTADVGHAAPGSAARRLRLGDHPIAKELASLGLPKRAMATHVGRPTST